MRKADKAFEQLNIAVKSIIEVVIFRLWFMLGKDSIKCHGGELVFIEEIKIVKGSANNGKEESQQ